MNPGEAPEEAKIYLERINKQMTPIVKFKMLLYTLLMSVKRSGGILKPDDQKLFEHLEKDQEIIMMVDTFKGLTHVALRSLKEKGMLPPDADILGMGGLDGH